MIKSIIIKFILPILFFIVLIFSISYKSIGSNNVIWYNDWSYYFNIEDKDSYTETIYSDDYFWSNLSSIIFLKKSKWEATNLLKKIWLNDFIVSYILSFWLLFLVAIIYYFIFSSISQNILFWYLSWVFVIFNNFTIESIAFWGFFYYSSGLISLGLLLFIFTRIYVNWFVNKKHLFTIILAWSIIILPIHLVIFTICIIGFFLFTKYWSKKKNNHLLVYWLIMVIWIHSYWIIPFIVNTLSVSSTIVYSGWASWVLDWYSKMASYMNIVSFRQYFNIISQQLFLSPIVNIFYISIIIGFFALPLSWSKKKFWWLIIFLFILYLIFFNISLWPNSALTWKLFQYLWDNISVFHFFRSFTRFIIILVPIILMVYALYIRENRNIPNQIIITITIIIWLVHFPLLSWDLKWVIPKMEIPIEYYELNEFLDKQEDTKNIISYPNINYELHSWNISSSNLMRQNYYFQETFLNANLIYDRASLQLKNKSPLLNSIFKYKFDDNLINNIKASWINYILVHKDYLNVFSWNIIPYNRYKLYFDNKTKKVIENEYFILYEIENSLKSIKLQEWNLKINKIDSTRYDLLLSVKGNDILKFYRNFDKNWILLNKKWEKVEFQHEIYNSTFNQWYIDIKKIGLEDLKINTDWSKNIELTLYYRMQNYYIIGKQISILFLCLVILLWIFWIFKNKRNEK